MFARTTADYWRDLGTPLAFVHGSADLVTGRAPSPLVGPPAEALIHPTAVVDPTARVTGGSSIGPYAVVDAHGNVTVAEGAQVHESVVDHDSSIGSESVCTSSGGLPQQGGPQNELPARLRLSCGIRIPAQAVRVTAAPAACPTLH